MGKKLSFIIFLFIAFDFSCQKEYYKVSESTQNLPVLPDSMTLNDSAQTTRLIFSSCKGCYNPDTLSGLKWVFKIDSSLLCGNITRAIVSPDRYGMTFFGPSQCSLDSGLIITAFFRDKILNEDQNNVTASHAYLQYYDNINTQDVLQSKRGDIFTLTIHHYMHDTGIATGIFDGTVHDKNGNTIKISDGRFIVKF